MTPSEEVNHLRNNFRLMSESGKIRIIKQLRDKAIECLRPIIKKVPRSITSDTVKQAFQKKGIQLDWNLATTDVYEFYFQAQKVGLSKSQLSAATLLYACTRAIEDEVVDESLQKLILDAYAGLDADFISSGRKFSQLQQDKAVQPRGKVTDDGKTIKDIIGKLAQSQEYTNLSAKQLWPHFFSELEKLELDPEEISATTSTYLYNFKQGQKSIAFKTFENKVSDFRKKKSQ